jgi:alpha-D-xyloside xylohydrolase
MLRRENNALVREYASEMLVIEPWGKDSLRVRSTMRSSLDEQDWALLLAESSEEPKLSIETDGRASITNGRITAHVDPRGQVGFFNQKGELLLEELMRVRLGDMTSGTGQVDQAAVSYFNSALTIYPREFKSIIGGDYSLTARVRTGKVEIGCKTARNASGCGKVAHGGRNLDRRKEYAPCRIGWLRLHG